MTQEPPFDKAKFDKDWIETYTGRQFRPESADASALSIIDIAHALSMQCRYNGHTRDFYSVAEHCCRLVFHLARTLKHTTPDEIRLNAQKLLAVLLHDAGEAYCSDIPRPLKHLCPDLVAAERRIEAMVAEWVGIESHVWQDMQSTIKEIDTRIIVDERAQVMNPSPNHWQTDVLEPLGVVIEGWHPDTAAANFLKLYSFLTKDAFGEPYYFAVGMGMPWGDTRVTTDATTRGKDLVEVDMLGGVGRIVSRTADGMMVRDETRGKPVAKTEWLHGKYTLSIPAA